MVQSGSCRALISSRPLDPSLAWESSRKRWGSNGLKNTVVVNRVQAPISRLIFQRRIALLLTFACWLDATFRLGMKSPCERMQRWFGRFLLLQIERFLLLSQDHFEDTDLLAGVDPPNGWVGIG